jgi:putative ABC transport system permease protein
VVLGAVAAARLGVADLPANLPAPQLYIGGHWFTVIGILAPVPIAPDIDRSVLVGWPAATTQLGFDGHPTVIYLKADESYLEDVRAVLPATIDPANPVNVLVTRPSDALAAKRATQSTYTALFYGLAGVALLVGGVGVANTMVVSVLERRREIGLRRALGASRRQIRAQFLIESIVLALLGGVAGGSLGVLGSLAYDAHQRWPMLIPSPMLADGLAGTLAIGMLAGVYPAVRAARLTPTSALAAT